MTTAGPIRWGSSAVYPQQQRFWIALLNLQRTWTDEAQALSFIPPRHRDFDSAEQWPKRKAEAYLLNNLELIRHSWERLEAGEPLDFDALNVGLRDVRLTLQPWNNLSALRDAARSKRDIGGRLESLQLVPPADVLNPGSRYIRSTIQRALYYFAQYVDYRLSDPEYPEIGPGRAHVRFHPDATGDLEFVSPTA